MDRLIKRTRMKCSEYNIIGKTDSSSDNGEETDAESNVKNKEYNAEIFDGDDFYHQLLRELIENKTSSDCTDSVAMTRKWLEIQRLRSKIKRNVDTKASKGRKIRYDTHAKLVNFMAPIDHSSYSDEAKDMLFASLFGTLS